MHDYKNKSDFKSFYQELTEQLNQLETNHPISHHFYDYLASGDTTLYQKYIKETKKFDEEWITVIESYLPSLNKIILSPKSTLKTHEEITNIEKAKNTNSQSIKHLSANSHFINQSSTRDVIPKRILTTYNEIDYGIYENRFIMSLIDGLVPFIRERTNLIKKNLDSIEKRRFYLHSDFPVNETNVQLELKFLLTNKPDDNKEEAYNQSLLERAEYIHKIILSLKNSNFMKLMQNKKPVKPPIIKTNIILKNVDYHNCYLLWLFIDRYNTLPFELNTEEKNLSFPKDYKDSLMRQVLLIYTNIISNQQKNKHIYDTLQPLKLTRKSIKVIHKHPDDFNLSLKDEVLEDHSLNQYYLEANKQIFRQSLDYHSQNNDKHELTLKKALKDTLNITNALYESFFELDGEEAQHFKKAFPTKDFVQSLSTLKTKSYISKVIREIKGVDYEESIKQELRYLDDILEHKDIIKNAYEQSELLEKETLLILNEKDTIEKLTREEKRIAIKTLEEATRLKTKVDEYRRVVFEEMHLYEQELSDSFNKKIKAYKDELKVKQETIINEYIEKYMPNECVTNEQIESQKQQIDEDRLSKEQRLVDFYEDKLSKTILKLDEDHETALLLEEHNYKSKFEENEANLQALKNYLSEAELSVQELEKALIQHETETIESIHVEHMKIKQDFISDLQKKYKITKIVTKEERDTKIRALSKRIELLSNDLKAKYEMRLTAKIREINVSLELDKTQKEQEIIKAKDLTDKNLKQLQGIMYYFKIATDKIRALSND